MTIVSGSVTVRARAIAAAMAWLDSGAGMMPSARANSMPAAKATSYSTATASIRPSSFACDTIGAMPW